MSGRIVGYACLRTGVSKGGVIKAVGQRGIFYAAFVINEDEIKLMARVACEGINLTTIV